MFECQNVAILVFRVLFISFSHHIINTYSEYNIYCVTHLSCRAATKTIDVSLRHPFLHNNSLQMTIR